MPHRVALEFHQNRFNVIYEQEEAIQKLQTAVADSKKKIIEAVGRLRDNHPVIDREKFKEVVESGFTAVDDHFGYIRSEPLVSVRTPANRDPVLDAVTDLLAGKVGQPYTAKEMEQVNSDAKRRAVRAQLASDQERLGAVTEQLQRLRSALSATSDSRI